MPVVFWILVALATVSCLFMAWALGANSNSPPFAPAIGANAVSTMRAALLIGILAPAGALAQGGAISETVGAFFLSPYAIHARPVRSSVPTGSGTLAPHGNGGTLSLNQGRGRRVNGETETDRSTVAICCPLEQR